MTDTVVRVEVFADGTVTLRGRPVRVPPGVGAEQAAIDRVCESATLLDQAVRVEIRRPDGSVVVVLVEPDGSVRAVPAATVPPQPTGPAVKLPVPAMLRGMQSVAAVVEPAAEEQASGDAVARSAPGGRRPPPRVRHTRTLLPEPRRAEDVPRRRRGLLVGAVVGAVLLGTLLAVSLAGGNSSQSSGPAGASGGPTKGEQVRVPVPGWARAAAWSVPVAVPGRGVVSAVVGRSAVAALTPDGTAVVVLDLRDGREVARATLPTDGPLHGLYGTPDFAVVHVGIRLLVLRLDGSAGPARTMDVPPGSRLSVTGTSVLVTYPGNGAMVVDGVSEQPVRVSRLPSGSTQLAADGPTVIASVPGGRWWRVQGDADGVEVVAAAPREGATVRQVRAGGHGRVVIAWSGPRDGMTTVAVHDATTGAVLARADAPTSDLVDPAWRWDGGRLAALGPLVLDLEQGTSRLVRGLDPGVVVDGVLYGRRGASESVAISATDPDRVQSLGQDVPLPWGGTRDRLLVVDVDKAGRMSLFGLGRC
jgi:hypothetical protein